jgi:hypothetical protein
MKVSWKLVVVWSVALLFLAGAVSLISVSVLPDAAFAGDPGDDTDLDTVPDATDNCIHTPNTNQLDADGDGRGNLCECGDFTGDGRVNTTDARLIQRCAVGEFACADLADVTCDGRVNTTDARIIQRFAVGQFGKEALTCAELLGACP